MPLSSFHPAVRSWFEQTFQQPTPCQQEAWPAIKRGEHTLIAAPTGSGKTLAAFLASIDNLIQRAERGELAQQVYIVYVSPLKALSNDIQRGLEQPLAAIQKILLAQGREGIEIRSAVRTGDTPQSQRTAMIKRPPHILVTTPESLYILLTSESGRSMLSAAEALIVDEIHAILGSKRGSHLSLSMERLQHLVQKPLVRIGLSATQRPLQRVADFLIGKQQASTPRVVIDSGHLRELDLQLELPPTPLLALLSGEAASDIYNRMADLVLEHTTTIIFVNTRRMAERVARHLTERLGVEHVSSHHGSLSREQRLDAEQRLKDGQLKVLVATASLELGIDIGDVDLVCQLGSTRSISTLLQRVGRSGHFLGGIPKGRLFPTSRDELLECIALLQAIDQGDLDITRIPVQPLDVLAQQLVAMVACEEWSVEHLHEVVSRAWPYRELSLEQFKTVLQMLADGYATQRGQRSAYLHWDRVNQLVRARKGARLTAMTCGGAIPDNAEYRVVLEPGEDFIGTVDEDFAIESLAGDIFQLGNNSWRILRVERDKLRVADAQHTPPTIPFWFGEAPGRSDALSSAVSDLLRHAQQQLETTENNPESLAQALLEQVGERRLSAQAAQQAANYLSAANAALGCLPSHNSLLLERFFDNSGGMQLILHAPFGSAINRAWGLALRKCFCRSFNFELQAAATENAIILSLGTSQSFELETVANYLRSASVRGILIQALLDSPMFTVRWRWNASCALAIKRFQGGRKTPPYLLRMQAEDLVTSIFPDQLACLENIQGEREVPEHPLVDQAINDCLSEAMNLQGLIAVLQTLESGDMQVVAKDVIEPSPLAAEILTAANYAFLDDAPAEERRTRAVSSRNWLDPQQASDLSQVNPAAIEQAVQQRKAKISTADELCDLLDRLGYLSIPAELEDDWGIIFDVLLRQARVTRLVQPGKANMFWVSAQRLQEMRTIHPDFQHNPELLLPEELINPALSRETAIVNIVRGRMATSAPISTQQLADSLAISSADCEQALLQLENEGSLLRGNWTAAQDSEQHTGAAHQQWCERTLLGSSHKQSIQQQRKAVHAVSNADFMRFQLRWQHLAEGTQYRGAESLALILQQLQGYEIPLSAWPEVLLSRVTEISDLSFWLDELCSSGQFTWLRLNSPGHSHTLTRSSSIAFVERAHLADWQLLSQASTNNEPSATAQSIVDLLTQKGALFSDELQTQTGLMQAQLDAALAELVALGLIRCDLYSGLTRLFSAPASRYKKRMQSLPVAGRWSLISPRTNSDKLSEEASLQQIATSLLRRYGIIFKALLARESASRHWGSLFPILQRMEWSGAVRAGRFVSGHQGMQFALPEALTELKKKPTAASSSDIIINSSDPLNLLGILTSGDKVTASANNRILLSNGLPIAYQAGKEVVFIEAMDETKQWTIRNQLLRNNTGRTN